MKKTLTKQLLAAAIVMSSLVKPGLSMALEELEEASLGDVTGEGIAFLPENAVMLFRGAGANEDVATLLANRANVQAIFVTFR